MLLYECSLTNVKCYPSKYMRRTNFKWTKQLYVFSVCFVYHLVRLGPVFPVQSFKLCGYNYSFFILLLALLCIALNEMLPSVQTLLMRTLRRASLARPQSSPLSL